MLTIVSVGIVVLVWGVFALIKFNLENNAAEQVPVRTGNSGIEAPY